MSHRPRKSSTCVTLVLIGAAAVSGCSDPPATARKAAYASKQECLADWGDEKECAEQQAAPRSGSSGSHLYWGPSSRSPSRSSGSGSSSSRSSSSSGSHSISHGGFGSHGSSAS